jgi:aspartate dehydrogenase
MAEKIKVGLVGCGAIGSELAVFLTKELKDCYKLIAVCDKNRRQAEKLVDSLDAKPQIITVKEVISRCEMIIEAASINAAATILKNDNIGSKTLLILSVGVFIKHMGLRNRIPNTTTTYIPSGAISGIDGVGSLSFGKIKKLQLITSKSPKSLAGIKYLKDKGVDVFSLSKETVVFRGPIKEAIANFPKNINVAATLFLASEFKDIEVIIKVNPKIKRNIHHIKVFSQEGNLAMKIKNTPSKINPKTSYMTVLSTKRLLKRMVAKFSIGS